MKNSIRRIAAVARTVMYVNMYIALITVMVIVVLTVVDITLRFVINKPIFGVPDLTMLSMIILCYLGIGYVAVKKRDIVVDLFNPKLPRVADQILSKLRLLLCLFLFGLLAWQGYAHALLMLRSHTLSPDLRIAIFPFYLVVCIGSILYCLEMLLQIFLDEDNVSQSTHREEKVEV
ncbi:TRAP transporter small permease [Chloroflexota bacterium]